MKVSKSTTHFNNSRKRGSPVRRRVVLGLVAAGAAAAVWRITGITGTAEAAKQVTLYKNPSCECCEGYADYLRHNGFEVKVIPTNDLTMMGEKYGIRDSLQPCHISLVDGYVVGGHVPVEVVNRLLLEKPAITGINLPGMPVGTPGMGGEKTEPLRIYEIAKGPLKVYAVV
jgi:hypothetical protein